jgi:hypothetical protein
MTPEPTKWHGSEAQRQRVAILREMHKQPRTLLPLPVAEAIRCAVRDLVNDYDEYGRSVWREPWPEERYRR